MKDENHSTSKLVCETDLLIIDHTTIDVQCKVGMGKECYKKAEAEVKENNRP